MVDHPGQSVSYGDIRLKLYVSISANVHCSDGDMPTHLELAQNGIQLLLHPVDLPRVSHIRQKISSR